MARPDLEQPATVEVVPHERVDRATGAGSVVFLGPSLPLSEARSVLPQATYLPPIAQGDLLSLVTPAAGPPPWAVGIVDGVFYQDLPVWHKEILFALEAGVKVFGASSMGALRAAECAPFGMVGVGEVFRRYATGELTDDDEVALSHAGADQGWRAGSEPLVNVRATLEGAVASGSLDPATASVVLAAAKQLWFPNRTIGRILEAAAAAGLGSDDVTAVREVLSNRYVDLKRLDAIELLTTIAQAGEHQDGGVPTAPPEPTGMPVVPLMRSGMFQAMFDRDRKIAHGDVTLRREEVVRHAALSDPGFAELRDRAVDRLLLTELADIWRVEATAADVEAETQRLRARLRLGDDEALDRWARDNDLSPAELEQLIVSEARARRLRDWMSISQSKRLLVDAVLTALKLQGRYETSVKGAAEHVRAALDDEAHGPDAEQPGAEELIRDQIRAGGWRPDVALSDFAEDAGFQDAGDVVEELGRYWQVRQDRRRVIGLLESLFEDDGQESSNGHGPATGGEDHVDESR